MDDTNALVENAGAIYSQDFSLNTLNILTAAGQKFEMRKLLVEFSFYEDLYSFCVSGHLTLKDGQGFIESLQLQGNEFLEIDFGKIKDASNDTTSVYRIYKVGDRVPAGNLNMEFYTLYFCSEELLISEQKKISKSLSGQTISQSISSILKENLGVKKAYIEETSGVYNFVVPGLKPLEAISWLSTYARPAITGAFGADMLFFETKYGYNFRSIQSMMRQSVYATYKYQQTNLPDDVETFQESTISVLNYEFVKTYDQLDDINSGTFANSVLSLDTLARTTNLTKFDYNKYKKNTNVKALDSNGALTPSQNRFGQTQNQTAEAKFKLTTSNSGQTKASYIKQQPGSVAKDIAIENYVPNRTAQLSLANYIVVKLTIPGDPGITVGRTIDFSLMTIKPTLNEREPDKFYSGKYLVTAVRHIIQSEGIYQTVLEIAKDSLASKPNSVDSSSPDWKKVIAD